MTTHKTKALRTATISRGSSKQVKFTLYRDSDDYYRWYLPNDKPIKEMVARSRQEAVALLESAYHGSDWTLLVGDRSNRELANRGSARLLKKHA